MNIISTLVTEPLANGLVLYYQALGGNLGWAIILFSLSLRVVLSPLTKPYMQSMKKMREHAPALEKIKKKHANDKQKLMQAQADFYKNKGINPGSGCLPYILQIVILLAFFNMFSRVLRGDAGLAVEFNKFLYDSLKFAEGASVQTKFWYLDLVKPDQIKVAMLPFALPGPVLLVGSAVQALVAKLSQSQLAAGAKAASKTKDPTDDFSTAMQSSMVYTMPLITLFAFMNFPSGLALYWLTFSLYQAVQQLTMSAWFKQNVVVKLGLNNGKDSKNKK